MRPRREKGNRHKRKTTKRSKLHSKSHCSRFLYIRNGKNSIEASDIESFNNIIRDHKSHAKYVKRTWKVVPKDSCEVYKDRRKRKVEENSKKKGSRETVGEPDGRDEQKPVKKRAKRRPLKRDSRGCVPTLL
ncbi:unnamed protein product [Leptosia nina]|uniref:Uncharacterized protein n=1 Tax=Leptosia nina TaxID=320188 RepID=A0AAV1JWZ9_9NEOP